MNMKMTISDISRDISDEARRNNLGFTNHANKRLRERKIPKNLLVSAIAETGGIVMTEDKNGDHNVKGTSCWQIFLASLFEYLYLLIQGKKVKSTAYLLRMLEMTTFRKTLENMEKHTQDVSK